MTSAINPQVLSALNSANGTNANTAKAAGSDATAGELRENFMTMLVTQLQNQDPMNPLENNELTSQLAQINTVNGVDNLNETLSGITSQIEAGQSLQATALIGRGVLVPGERLLVGEEGAATPFGVELDEPATQLTARIVGSDGQALHSIERESVNAGVETITWDGTLENGEAAPAGAYRVEVEAVNEAGETMDSVALNYAVVNGVSSGENGARLDLGGISEQVGLEDVRQIL